MTKSCIFVIILFYTQNTLSMNLWHPLYCVASFMALAYGAPNGNQHSNNGIHRGDRDTPLGGTFFINSTQIKKEFAELKKRQEALEKKRKNEPYTVTKTLPGNGIYIYDKKPDIGPYTCLDIQGYEDYCQHKESSRKIIYTKCSTP